VADNKYSIALSAVDKFSAPFKSFEQTSEKLTEGLRVQQAELRKLNSSASDLRAFDSVQAKLEQTASAMGKAKAAESALAVEHDRLSSELQRSGVAIDSAKQKHFQLTLQVEGAEKPTRALLRAQREAGQMVKQLEREHGQLGKQLEATARDQERAALKTSQLSVEHQTQTNRLAGLESGLSEAGVDARRFAEEQERIKRETDQANDALKMQQTRLKSVSDAQGRMDANRAARADLRGQVLETAAMGYIAAQPIRAAINYESSMADVKKVVNFEDDAEADKMGRDILKMSTQIPMAADGIAEIVSAAGQSGVAKAELLDFATSAAKMATAFDVSAEEAGSTMAAWRASMGLSQDQAVALADATNYLSNNMNAQAKDIAGVLKRQGAVAMGAGLNETQAASLSAALLSGGAGEEVAATALKNITGALMKGDTGTAAQRGAWADLGFDPNQLASDMMTDAPDTMIRVFEAMQDVPEEQVSALVSTLFGEEVKGSVMPMLKNLDNLRNSFEMTADATKYRGSMEDEYRARSATTANEIQLLSNKFERLQISVGTLLLPALNDLLGPIADGADILADAAEKYPTIAKGIAMVGIGLVGLKVGALALKMVGLQFGQGMNAIKLGRAKLNATTGNTAKSATLADRALRRMNATMNRMGRGRSAFSGAGADLGDYSGGDSRKGKKGRRFKAGKWGRIAGMVSGGAALSMMSASADAGELAMAGADAAGATSELLGAAPMAALKTVGKLVKPLDLLLSGAALSSTVANGSAEEIGATSGDIVGGLGGSAAGAMAGAAIGSVVPIVGTAVGGIIGSIVGGLGGGSIGEWAGGKIGSWFGDDKLNGNTDKLPSPEKVQKEVTKSETKRIVFAPSISIPASSGDIDADKRLIDALMERMKAEFVPLMSDGDLSVRMDATLMDGGSA